MTKARQRERAKRRKNAAPALQGIPMHMVHGYVNGIEKPINFWDGKRIRFVEPPPKGAIITIQVDTKVMEGIKCK